jgi:predicted RNase H-like HicB family nuclease
VGLRAQSSAFLPASPGTIQATVQFRQMELAIHVQIEELPEGLFLATSDELQGLVAQGRTVAETLEIARDVARKLLDARAERGTLEQLPSTSDRHDYTIVVAA